ncbi:MAG: class I SAM-dependent methyltransferase [Candidatus Methanomethylicia archaeon]
MVIKKLQKILHELSKQFILEDYMGEKNLNLGCGNRPLKNFINIDYWNTKYADEVVDLNQILPYEDESIDLIYSDNVFEHVQNLIGLIKECHRVLKKDGYLIIRVPYFKSKHAFVDPTHVHFFTVQSMDYFVEGTYFYNQYRFFDESFSKLEIFFEPQSKSFVRKIVSLYATKRPNQFENSIWSNIFVFHNIIYVLKK